MRGQVSRLLEYRIPIWSFREYLNLLNGWSLKAATLDEILEGKVRAGFRPQDKNHWTKQKFDTMESPKSDFEIDGKTFEVGGAKTGIVVGNFLYIRRISDSLSPDDSSE